MKLKHLIFAIILAAASADSSPQGVSQKPDEKSPNAPPPSHSIGSVPLQERGPSFSSPGEVIHENGDRVGHYPPYYHPESGGNH